MKMKNIVLVGLLLPAITFPSNESLWSSTVSRMGAIGNRVYKAGTRVGSILKNAASITKNAACMPYEHPKLTACFAASWLAYCKWSTWDMSANVNQIERLLDGASPTQRKRTGQEKSLWNWRLHPEKEEDLFWQTAGQINNNGRAAVVEKLKNDFNGKTKEGYKSTIAADKKKLESYKRQLERILRRSSFIPQTLHLNDESRFESFIDSLTKRVAEGELDNGQVVEDEIDNYCSWFSWNGSCLNYPIKFLHHMIFPWEAKAARLYWNVLRLQARLDAIETVINSSDI